MWVFLKIVILHVLSVIHMYSDYKLMHTVTNYAFWIVLPSMPNSLLLFEQQKLLKVSQVLWETTPWTFTFSKQGTYWDNFKRTVEPLSFLVWCLGEHWFHKLREKGSWQNWTLGKMRNYLRGLEGETSVIQRTREHKPTMGSTIFPAPFNQKFQNSATWNITEWKGQFWKKFSDICVCLPRLSSLSQFLLHVHNRHSKMKGKANLFRCINITFSNTRFIPFSFKLLQSRLNFT